VRGSKVAVIDIGGFSVAVASYDGIRSTRAMGEKELYSVNAAGTKLASCILKDTGHLWIGNRPTGKNLGTVLTNLIQGIQGATFGGYPLVDATGKITAALSDLSSVLDNTP
jgi:hypothetical protein